MGETLIICDNCGLGIDGESPLVVCDNVDLGAGYAFCSIECLLKRFDVRQYEKAIYAKGEESLDLGWER